MKTFFALSSLLLSTIAMAEQTEKVVELDYGSARITYETRKEGFKQFNNNGKIEISKIAPYSVTFKVIKWQFGAPISEMVVESSQDIKVDCEAGVCVAPLPDFASVDDTHVRLPVVTATNYRPFMNKTDGQAFIALDHLASQQFKFMNQQSRSKFLELAGKENRRLATNEGDEIQVFFDVVNTSSNKPSSHVENIEIVALLKEQFRTLGSTTQVVADLFSQTLHRGVLEDLQQQTVVLKCEMDNNRWSAGRAICTGRIQSAPGVRYDYNVETYLREIAGERKLIDPIRSSEFFSLVNFN